MVKKNQYFGKTGVYQIRNIINEMVYIGSSIDIATRWREHEYDLRTNQHRNKHLQNAYNKYGKDAFVYEVLEILKENQKDEQFEREQYWINRKEACNKSKGYNIQSEVLIIPKATKKVICLETKEVFDSLKEAEKAKNISSGSISCCCHKRKLKQAGGYHWRFYDEYVNMTEKEIEEVIYDVSSYPFICLDDEKIYKSWKELPYKKGVITRCCNCLARKKYAKCGGKQYMFLKDYTRLTKEEIEEIRALKANIRNSGEVVCLETGLVYEHAHKGMLETGIPDTTILNCCYKKAYSALGTHWMFKEEYDSLSAEQIQDIVKNNGYKNNRKPIICLETKEIFKSGVEACSVTGVSVSMISKICLNGGINMSSKSYHFMFLEEYEQKSEQAIQNILSIKPKHLRKVFCVEKGKIFSSVAEAARSVGGQTTNISKCCKNPKRTCKGYHWEYRD